MKGIILAGGLGQRLYPLTTSISKQLLPIYDKPMIYYPLSILMIAGIKDIILITTSVELSRYKALLGDGSRFGIKINYVVQTKPNGIAESFLLSQDFITGHRVCLILGDNIFYGQGLKEKLINAINRKKGATVFAYKVRDPRDFGVIEYSSDRKAVSIEEKPKNPKSNNVLTGLYFYDKQIVDIAKSIKPSKRNELEITDINKIYLKNKELYVEDFGRGFAWLDTGTPESLLEAGQFIQTIEKRQNLKVACLEEIACRNKWISKNKMLKIGKALGKTDYGKYLINISKTIEF